jgi:hypothetical protein
MKKRKAINRRYPAPPGKGGKKKKNRKRKAGRKRLIYRESLVGIEGGVLL